MATFTVQRYKKTETKTKKMQRHLMSIHGNIGRMKKKNAVLGIMYYSKESSGYSTTSRCTEAPAMVRRMTM